MKNGSQACLKLEQVQSLSALEEQHGPYDAVIVAAGAAAAVLPEVGRLPPSACLLTFSDLSMISRI